MLNFLRLLIPKKLMELLRSPYHFLLSFLGAVRYGFPSKKMFIIGVTGTKGKSTVVELISATLKAAGFSVASTSTIRFSINNKVRDNKYKMTMPGRFFLQRFLSEAIKNGCTHAVIEMTSEGARQHRHRFVYMDTLVFLNLSPEHIESHGSYKNYKKAKLSLAKALEKSPKPKKTVIVNSDDSVSKDFLSVNVDKKIKFSLSNLENLKDTENGLSFVYQNEHIVSSLRGIFNASNICATLALAESIGIPISVPKRAIALTEKIDGRVEEVKVSKDQPFKVYVDYAHTPDSLKNLYETFRNDKTICVLGGTGGGRDKWKRPEMGKIADEFCTDIILTNEDPYNEPPESILEDIKEGIKNIEPEIIIDRRLAIRRAFKKALEMSKKGNPVSVLITGKGTDPYIMVEKGKKIPWSDLNISVEELRELQDNQFKNARTP